MAINEGNEIPVQELAQELGRLQDLATTPEQVQAVRDLEQLLEDVEAFGTGLTVSTGDVPDIGPVVFHGLAQNEAGDVVAVMTYNAGEDSQSFDDTSEYYIESLLGDEEVGMDIKVVFSGALEAINEVLAAEGVSDLQVVSRRSLGGYVLPDGGRLEDASVENEINLDRSLEASGQGFSPN